MFPMLFKKIITHHGPFIAIGGGFGFILVWLVVFFTGQGAESAFWKAAIGAVVGGFLFRLWAQMMSKLLGINQKKTESLEKLVDK